MSIGCHFGVTSSSYGREEQALGCSFGLEENKLEVEPIRLVPDILLWKLDPTINIWVDESTFRTPAESQSVMVKLRAAFSKWNLQKVTFQTSLVLLGAHVKVVYSQTPQKITLAWANFPATANNLRLVIYDRFFLQNEELQKIAIVHELGHTLGFHHYEDTGPAENKALPTVMREIADNCEYSPVNDGATADLFYTGVLDNKFHIVRIAPQPW